MPLPIAWAASARAGVRRATRESGLSAWLAGEIVSHISAGALGATGRLDLSAAEPRIRQRLEASSKVRPKWLRRLGARTMSKAVSRFLLGRLRKDPVAWNYADPAQVRDQVAASIERVIAMLAVRP